jgi:hypothetical protein
MLEPEARDHLGDGSAGIVAFMSHHGLAHCVVPRVLAEDIARLFPFWLRVLKDHPGAGQQEPPRPPRDPATPPADIPPADIPPAGIQPRRPRADTHPARVRPRADTRLRRLRVRRRRADLTIGSGQRRGARAMQRLPVASRRGASFKLHSLPRYGEYSSAG